MINWSPPQLELFEVFADPDVKIIICVGPVQCGKTHAGTWSFMEWATRSYSGEDFILASRTARQMSGATLKYAETFSRRIRGGWRRRAEPWVLRSALGAAYNRYFPLIGNDSGAEDKARSFSAAGALLDEGTLLPPGFVSAVQDRLSRPGAKMVVLTNPAGTMHPLKTGLVDLAETEPSVHHIQFRLSDNPSLDEDYVAWLSKRHTGAMYQRMVLGNWANAEGLLWPDMEPQIVDPPDPATIWRWTVGMDWAHSSVTAGILVGRDVDGNDWAVDEYWHDGNEDGQLGEVAQAKRVATWLRRTGHPISAVWVDPSAVAFARALTTMLPGVPVRGADNDLDNGLQFVRTRFEDHRLWISRKCENLISEGLNYEYDPKAALIGEDKPMKGNDHSCDALRYCLWSQTAGDARGPITLIRGRR